MGFEALHPSENEHGKPEDLAMEAARRLSRRPEGQAKLQQFVDMWGIDGYDPFGPDGCSEMVRQIVLAVLVTSRHIDGS